ncbi:trypsin-like peptidase domain-containing protein [Gordonia alkaliphila]|uniref:Trypsin-like peptidase domain-containing protein n=1 Tax=Gordonia alkaliphila TaxID=1053547 RepID=A0ABP8Z715_9ACTN|nr:trypsin-like peptidase domain-containing protein [Gordonia alkaliphila]MCK0440091.1 trypsin-like peptidase domain-containing protein [Gordonia alkaliphila]
MSTTPDWATRDEADPQPAPARREHPAVSPQTAAVFGRPDGVAGSFSTAPSRRPQPELAPPDPVLAEAFSRPAGASSALQRDPYATYGSEVAETEPDDPWRDPASGAHLEGPALAEASSTTERPAGPKLGVTDLLFGRRVHWWALASLAIVALLVGVAGGLIGRWTAEAVPPLNSNSVSLDVDDSAVASTDIAKVAKAVAPSVVMIEVRTAGSGGSGSGFVVDKLGYIVTNNHVISLAANDKSAKLEVVFSDHSRVPARIVGRDVKTDVAVLKVDNVENLTVAKLGDSAKLEIGQPVIAFGAPLGLDRTVTTGIVSAVDRPVPLRPDASSDTDAVINAIQTDAAINPGNSGGPLVDGQGRVIGINTAIAAAGGGSIGLGFAIPINEVIPITEALIKDGSMRHPQIGVTASTVRNDQVFGARVKDVAAGSPAASAGIKENDVITEFDGKPIEGADELTVAVRTSTIGEEVKYTYWRDGRTFTGTITPRGD